MGHGKHSVLPVVLVNLPESQAMQVPPESAENVPMGQGLQTVLPVVTPVVDFPAGQSSQLNPSMPYCPMGQLAQSAVGALVPPNCPALQMVVCI